MVVGSQVEMPSFAPTKIIKITNLVRPWAPVSMEVGGKKAVSPPSSLPFKFRLVKKFEFPLLRIHIWAEVQVLNSFVTQHILFQGQQKLTKTN